MYINKEIIRSFRVGRSVELGGEWENWERGSLFFENAEKKGKFGEESEFKSRFWCSRLNRAV